MQEITLAATQGALAATQGPLAATQGPAWELETSQAARLAIVWNTSKLQKEHAAQFKVFSAREDCDNKRRNFRYYLQARHPYIGTL